MPEPEYDDIPEDIQRSIKKIVDTFDREDVASRERQIRQWKKLEYMWAGFTRIWWDTNAHDWRVFDETVYDDRNYTGYYDRPINVFRAYLESIIAALSSTVPGVKCVPDDADNPDDITTAKGGNEIAELIYKHVDAPLLWVKALFTFSLQGMVAAYNYTVEDEEYGTAEVPQYDEENEETLTSTICAKCGMPVDSSADGFSDLELSKFDPNDEDAQLQFALTQGKVFCPNCLEDTDPRIKQEKLIVPRFIGNKTQAKARQCIEILGGLYVKVPNYARCQKDIPYLAYCYEAHYTQVISKYPHLRDKYGDPTVPTSSGTEFYERWGRLSPQYYGEQPANTPTCRNWWLRPSAFEMEPDEKLRKQLIKMFPNGCKAVFVNEDFAEACNQNLDDHWTLTYNPVSDYIHFEPLGQLLVPIQEISQDLTSLTIQTIEHGIPQVFADPSVVDFKAYQQTEASPGTIYPAKPRTGKSLSDGFYMISTATLSGEVMPFGNFIQEQGQFVSGALPSLFGGAQPGSSRTAAQYSMSRNQALQRLQNTWKMINYWWKNIFSKVIPAYMKDMLEDERLVKEQQGSYINVLIKKMELTGKIGSVECESSDTLPMTWGQVKDTVMELLQTGNPDLYQTMTAPENIDTFQNITGLNRFKVPGLDDKEKQFEEIQILITQEPTQDMQPDPAFMQAAQAGMVPPGMQPPMVPIEKASIPIEMDVDNHKVEADVCRSYLVSEAGRLLKTENPAGYQNLLLHMKEHIQAAQQIAMMNGPAPMPQGQQPPSPKMRPVVNKMFRLNLSPFYSPDDVLTPSDTGDLSIDDIEKALEDDATTDTPPPSEKEVTEEEGPEEAEESTEEPEETSEAEVELKDDDVVLNIPRRQEILKEFPDLFKKFPTIESAIYREKQFSEIFPTIVDAKQAASDIEALRSFESDLMNGSLEATLRAVKSTDDRAFRNLTSPENLLSTLQKVDNEAFLGTIGFAVKSVLKNAHDRAKSMGGEDGEQLGLAAQYLHRFLFNTPEVSGPQIAPKQEVDPARSEYNQRLQDLNQRDFNAAVSSVTETVEKHLRNILDKSIDPKSMMTPYVKEKAVEDALSLARKEVQGDQRFRAILNRQWQAAARARFSPDSLKVVRQTIVDANKSAFKSAIVRVRADALKGSARTTSNKSRDDRPVERGRPANSSKSSPSKPAPREKTLDFLLRD